MLTKKRSFANILLLLCCIIVWHLAVADSAATNSYAQKKISSIEVVEDNIYETADRKPSEISKPVPDILDLQWLNVMNYTQLLLDMDNALGKGNVEQWVQIVSQALDTEQMIKDAEISEEDEAKCSACKTVVDKIRYMVKNGTSKNDIMKKFVLGCTALKFHTQRVCEGTINLIGLDLIDVVVESPMTPSQICNFYYQQDVCLNGDDERHNWRMSFPPKQKPAQHPTEPPPKNAPKLKVLQITDTHYDPFYQVGANTICNGEPTCCRETSGPPVLVAATAKKWGDYGCDSPKILLENAFQHIVDTHKDIDYIMWTGDMPAHDTWNQTKEGNLEVIRESVEMVAKYFKGIPIYPTVGNHESSPIDTFAPLEAPARRNMSWLYDQLDVEWRRWLPSGTSETIKRGAFYSVLVKPGFRIIAINSNYCAKANYWLIKNSTDPAGQLAWLIRELDAAENNDEKVHIIGHMPPGQYDCIRVWSKNYYDIINRYEATVMAQFFGHTHYDEYEVFYDTKNFKRPLNVAYISPSLTPWVHVNPAYRIYYVDGDRPNTSRAIVDHETWKLDLIHANKYDEPTWHKAYTATTAYNMTSLMPTEWDNLITRMSKDENLFQLFYRNHYRDTPVSPKCGPPCKKRIMCNLKSGKSGSSKTFCEKF